MKLLSRFNIGARLVAGFAALLLLTLVVGLFSMDRLGRVNGATADLATNWLPATRALGEYGAAMSTVRRAEALHLMSTAAADLTTEEQRIQAGKAQAAEAWKHYIATVTTDEERKLARAVEDGQRRYLDALDKLLQVSRAGPAQLEEAKAIYRGATREAFNAMMAALDADIRFQSQGAETAYRGSQAALTSPSLSFFMTGEFTSTTFMRWSTLR